jgi:hypothetical protein
MARPKGSKDSYKTTHDVEPKYHDSGCCISEKCELCPFDDCLTPSEMKKVRIIQKTIEMYKENKSILDIYLEIRKVKSA